jgi:curli biogenesis system outer membrane secretion channel CsgG
MRKHLICLFACLFLTVFTLGFLGSSAMAKDDLKGLKKRVAVAGFENKAPRSNYWYHELGDGFAEQLTEALVKSEKYTVLERAALGDILKEQDLANSGRVSKPSGAKTGKILGAKVLIRGTVTDFEMSQQGGNIGVGFKGFKAGISTSNAHVEVNIRGYDTETSELLFSESRSKKINKSKIKGSFPVGNDMRIGGSAFNKSPLGEACMDCIKQCVDVINKQMKGIPWESRVLKISSEKIYIRGGSDSNITQGMKFAVYSQGEELIDPDTGLSLGSEEDLIGHVEVTSVKEKFSISKIIDGDGFEEKFLVREK